MIDTLLFSWRKNGDYAQRLVADVPEQRMTFQPGPGVNHPAWILSHLIAYHPVIVAVIQREPFDDPKGHEFGMQSKPLPDPDRYAPKERLAADFAKGHRDVEDALGAADPAIFQVPISLPRWKEAMPTTGLALGYLMLLHEALHLGQFSAWRRVQGLAGV